MTYETMVPELLERLPALGPAYVAMHLDDKEHLPTVVMGAILLPALERALDEQNLAPILKICAFLEDAAIAAQDDPRLESLLKTEVGEWLNWAANEDLLAPWLGTETKRLCGYVPGLATQRLTSNEPSVTQSFTSRIAAFVQQLRSK